MPRPRQCSILACGVGGCRAVHTFPPLPGRCVRFPRRQGPVSRASLSSGGPRGQWNARGHHHTSFVPSCVVFVRSRVELRPPPTFYCKQHIFRPSSISSVARRDRRGSLDVAPARARASPGLPGCPRELASAIAAGIGTARTQLRVATIDFRESSSLHLHLKFIFMFILFVLNLFSYTFSASAAESPSGCTTAPPSFTTGRSSTTTWSSRHPPHQARSRAKDIVKKPTVAGREAAEAPLLHQRVLQQLQVQRIPRQRLLEVQRPGELHQQAQ